jgi:peptidoglycan/xylan/chitin deacetylase (PgdA/CDA1 family)
LLIKKIKIFENIKLQKASISINFDSLRTIISKNFLNEKNLINLNYDPCFFQVKERFLEFSDKFNFKYSVFVVGKDLENPNLAKEIKCLYEDGHEIGNHTYSHFTNFGGLSREKIREEIVHAHDLISILLKGSPPCGFVAPSWYLTSEVIDVLKEKNYLYDCSTFPSFIMPLLQLQLKLWSYSTEAAHDFNVIRKDIRGNLFGSTIPYMASNSHPWAGSNNPDGVISLPLPTLTPRIAFWHSWAFKLSNKTYEKWLRSALKKNPFFYLVLHPADLIDPEKDLKQFPSSLMSFERMAIPLKYKMEKMQIALEVISEKRDIVHMKQLAYLAKADLFQSKIK